MAFIVEVRKLVFAFLVGILIIKIQLMRHTLGINAIGEAGYSIYALHAPVVYTLLALSVPWYIVLIGAILLGLAVFRVYENPFIAMGKRLAVNQENS